MAVLVIGTGAAGRGGMAYQGILPGVGVAGVLVEEVVVRLLEVVVVVLEDDAWVTIVHVAV